MDKTNRRKKKKQKKQAWDAEYAAIMKSIRDIDRNGEGYNDPTCAAALRNLLRQGY